MVESGTSCLPHSAGRPERETRLPTIASANVPTPKSWDEFEDILLSASKLRWKSADFSRNGRQGQKQDGVDVFGHDDAGRHLGVQAKNTIGGISEAVIKDEIAKAEKFEPKLDALYIATSAPRDAPIQKVVRTLSQQRAEKGLFSVHILFWDDVIGDLAQSDDEFFKHYPQLKAGPKEDLAKAHDAKLFEELMALLPANGVIRFVDQTNMAGFSFLRAALDPLEEFSYNWGDAGHEFLHEPLEQLRKKLYDVVNAYLDMIGANTWPLTTIPERSSVPPEWELEQPERFTKVVGTIHGMAGDIVSIYGDLVRTAKGYLLR